MYLFVYGSLLSFNSRGYMLKGSKLIGEAVLEDFGLYEVDWYPGIVPRRGSKVRGELYEVSEELLREIDEYEGILYERRKVRVSLEGGKMVEAWTYVYLGEVEEERYIPFDLLPWREKRSF